MKIKKILISQPAPADLEKSPYRNLIKKHNVDITFYKFFEVVGIPVSEFRKTRIHISEYSAIIFNSKNSIDHFFRMLKELRETVSEEMKYFCSTETIALYLQNYIQYRKRKVFFGNQYFSDLLEVMSKHREEKFLFPCSDEKQTEYTKALDKAKFKYTKAPMYTSAPKDLTKFKLEDYDALALFSPIGVRSLVKSFPDIKDRNIIIAAFGTSTHAALKEQGIKLTIAAPTQSAPSMAMAIENYIMGKEQDAVIVSKGDIVKHSVKNTIASSVKKAKPVIANKEIYKQRMEEKKAQAAARRAARAAERAKAEMAKAEAEKAEKAKEEKMKAEKAKVAAKAKVVKPKVSKAKPAASKPAAAKSTTTKPKSTATKSRSTAAKPKTTAVKPVATKTITAKTTKAKTTATKPKTATEKTSVKK